MRRPLRARFPRIGARCASPSFRFRMVEMRLLLLLPFVGLLWLPFYDRLEPRLFGFPFFYWYQLAWVPVTALLTALVNLRSRP